ncbi:MULTISPECIES: Hsp20/alpha crystallin family protein [unclassified Bacillus (in: firmicutes)]|uniref:Hsp20/alpha crystallin family protein n=1 Tax=unclassified Bacillus (in: firmicutes) TaxID=185979 RepID=UPI0008EF7A29|nr:MULTISPECIES: Hsp20/alpha crystallin family protein [unclassified Bacillus (in: firmicutes)]SFA88883.1 HSP20 family protein [Bacillus sp. UNCCL13]SFQ84733.1 HSP20 family protein [Bacillus sp. cl95]
MSSNSEEAFIDQKSMEKWLENFFLDPLTTYLDHSQFRIDLFETDTHLIVEALLSDYHSSEVSVYIEKQKLIITAAKLSLTSYKKSQVRNRTVEFPFLIITKKVEAAFREGVLEVSISKKELGLGKDCFITLP